MLVTIINLIHFLYQLLPIYTSILKNQKFSLFNLAVHELKKTIIAGPIRDVLRYGAVVVERSSRMREIGVRSPVGTDVSR